MLPLTGAGSVDARLERVEELIGGVEARMEHHHVPGLGLALIEDGEVVCERAYGLVEAGTPNPVTTTTRFQACSISKPVTALGMLRLVEQGVLDLDADVNARLSAWRIPPNGSWQPRVTLRQIVSHTAGLTAHGFPGYARDARRPTLVQVLTGTAPANTEAVRVDTIPGTQFRYSGGGTTVMQLLLEEVTGSGLADLLANLVLEPLELRCSDFTQPLREGLWDDAATAHDTDGTPVGGGWHVYPEQAAAGLWTTSGDLARYAVALQQAYAGRPAGIVSPRTAAEMLAPQTPPSDPIDRLGGLNAVGLGPFVRWDGGATTYFGHSGGNEGFRCHLLAHRDAGLGAAVMTNSDAGSPLIAELLNAIAEAFAWPHYVPADPPVSAGEASVEPFTGAFELPRGTTVTVTRRGDGIDVQVGDQDPIRFVRISETEFASQFVETTLSFTDPADGTAELTLRQNGADLTCRRRA